MTKNHIDTIVIIRKPFVDSFTTKYIKTTIHQYKHTIFEIPEDSLN